ncbi:PAS domain S-box protein [Nonlabens sp. Asnod3-H03]|uniref:PAS domain-containing sensor histidine kinase n=1 Tax=Nonlabens sp. Asnod3-H03 TaxID=3160580 RepID=UPI0038703E71
MAQEYNTNITDQINILIQAPIAVAFLDNNLRYVAHSAKWCEDYKLQYTDIKGMHHYDLFPEVSEEWKIKLQNVLKGAEEYCDEELFSRKDGTEQWLKWNVKPWYDYDNEIAGMIIVSEDITSQVILRKRDQLDYRILLSACTKASIGTWHYNNINGELYWSSATKALHELPEDYQPDASNAILFYKEGDSRNKITQAFINSLTKNESYDLELELITAKGNSIWVRAIGQSDFVDGVCHRQYGTFEDISDRKKKEHQSKLNSEKFQKLFRNSKVGVAIMDATTLQLLDVNNALVSISKINNADLLNSSFEELIDKKDFCIWFDKLQKLLNRKRDHIKQPIKFQGPDGSIIYTQTICNVLEDEYGEPENLVIQIIDITKEKQATQERKVFVDEIMQKNDRLLNFAYIVSHNLRSHSSNFKGLINFYLENDDEEIRSKIMSMLNNSSDNLNQTIEDLNQVVSIQTTHINFHSISLCEFVQKVLGSISLELLNSDYSITLDIEDQLKIDAFPAYLESALSNLITNSIKYRDLNKSLSIIITATQDNGVCTISVSDNGLGIDLSRHQDKIFGMYKTFHNHENANGLGLFMTKNQVEAMGGTISVRSEVGIGSTFTIKI